MCPVRLSPFPLFPLFKGTDNFRATVICKISLNSWSKTSKYTYTTPGCYMIILLNSRNKRSDIPLFSLVFLGIVNLRGSMGICLWWLPWVAEFLLSILPPAALSLPGAAWVSQAECNSITSPSCKLVLAPSSGAADTLLGRAASYPLRGRLSSIVVFSNKLTPLFPTASLLLFLW